MTLCFATWHRRRRRLRISNAGQEQPFLYHGGKCEKIPLAGFPLGLFEEAVYEERSYILDPGDILVFHSDGIADAQSLEGKFFGHDGLKKFITEHHDLSADQLADRLLAEADHFSGGRHPSDDRTLVVLKVQ